MPGYLPSNIPSTLPSNLLSPPLPGPLVTIWMKINRFIKEIIKNSQLSES